MFEDHTWLQVVVMEMQCFLQVHVVISQMPGEGMSEELLHALPLLVNWSLRIQTRKYSSLVQARTSLRIAHQHAQQTLGTGSSTDTAMCIMFDCMRFETCMDKPDLI